MTTIRWPRPGERVVFWHADAKLEGTCNGDPRGFDRDLPHVLTHIPVYVRDGNKCLMVAAGNVLEWPDGA